MPPEPSNAVFISYRRDVSQYMAMALWQNLTDRGIDVFYDIESIKAGHFDDVILSQIAARPYMVPILAQGTLNRCVDEGDWLRRELEAGIDGGRVLVPVHTPEFSFDDIDKYLPADLADELARFQMLEIPPSYFKDAIRKLADEFLVPMAWKVAETSVEAAAAAVQQTAESGQANPVTEEALTAEAHSARGYDADERGDHQAAVDAYTEAIRLNPNDARSYYNRGCARDDLGQYEAAIADFGEVILLNPDDVGAFFNRGLARHNQGNPEAAVEDYNVAIRLNPDDADTFLNRGLALHDLGDYHAAIEDYDQVIRLNPNDADAFTDRGRASHELEHYSEAIRDYQTAIRLNPFDARAFYNRGRAHFDRNNPRLHDHQRAIADFDTAFRLNPEYVEAHRGRRLARESLGDVQAAEIAATWTDSRLDSRHQWDERRGSDAAESSDGLSVPCIFCGIRRPLVTERCPGCGRGWLLDDRMLDRQ